MHPKGPVRTFTTAQHNAALKRIRRKRELQEKKLRQEYARVFTKWYKAVIPHRIGMVVEPPAEFAPFRLVIDAITPYHHQEGRSKTITLIQIGGWLLNKKSIPYQWRTFIVYGSKANTKLVFSENQFNRPVPNHLVQGAPKQRHKKKT